MEDYPHTISEFRRRFSTEEACLDYLAKFKWPDGIICPKCQRTEHRQTKRGLFECGKWCELPIYNTKSYFETKYTKRIGGDKITI